MRINIVDTRYLITYVRSMDTEIQEYRLRIIEDLDRAEIFLRLAEKQYRLMCVNDELFSYKRIRRQAKILRRLRKIVLEMEKTLLDLLY